MFVPQNRDLCLSSAMRWLAGEQTASLLATDKEPNICFYLCVAQNNRFHAEFQTQNAITHAVLSASGAADFELALSARLFTFCLENA